MKSIIFILILLCSFCGNLSAQENIKIDGVARLNEDGSIDESFLRNIILEKGCVYSVIVTKSDKIIIGGDFSYNEFNSLLCLNSDGSLDAEFCKNVKLITGKIYTLKEQNDGKVLVGGDLVFEGNENLIRLNSDGTIDSSFCCEISKSLLVKSIACQRDDKILIGGYVNDNTVLDSALQRLNKDGSIDESDRKSVV
jgi:uncharacterized delta-60 repeat protein